MISLNSIRAALAVSAAALLGTSAAAVANAAQVTDPLSPGALAAPPAKTVKLAAAKKKKPASQPMLMTPAPDPAAAAALAAAPDQATVPADASAAVAPAAPVKPMAGMGHAYQDGTFQGPKVDAAWGLLQIEATVAGGQIVTVDVVPGNKGKPPGKVVKALSMLKSEAIKTQKAKVHVVSGATTTSKAFMRSLAGALKQASAGG
jgi:uncharacterized protein with FMN-binding domain